MNKFLCILYTIILQRQNSRHVLLCKYKDKLNYSNTSLCNTYRKHTGLFKIPPVMPNLSSSISFWNQKKIILKTLGLQLYRVVMWPSRLMRSSSSCWSFAEDPVESQPAPLYFCLQANLTISILTSQLCAALISQPMSSSTIN